MLHHSLNLAVPASLSQGVRVTSLHHWQRDALNPREHSEPSFLVGYYLYFLHLFAVCLGHLHATAHSWRSENTSKRWFILSGDQTAIVGLGDRHLHPLSCLAGPGSCFIRGSAAAEQRRVN